MVCGGYLVETLTLNLPLDCKEREEESVIWGGWEREEECGGWWEEGGRLLADLRLPGQSTCLHSVPSWFHLSVYVVEMVWGWGEGRWEMREGVGREGRTHAWRMP